MQGSLTGDSLFAHLMMQRQVDPRLFLLIEGDEELAILTGHIDDLSVMIFVGGGKPTVLRAGALIDDSGMGKAAALIDRDLDDFTGASANYPTSMIVTDGYDFSSDVLTADWEILRRAAVAHGGVAAVKNIEVMTSSVFIDSVRRLSSSIISLRLVNQELALGLNLRGFPYQDIIDGTLEPLAADQILARANQRSSTVVLLQDVKGPLEQATARINKAPIVPGGHDIFGATSAMLRASGASGVGAKQIAASVFTAANCELMTALSVVTKIQAWAAGYSMRAFTCS